jgi:primosomal protein N'
MKNKYAQIVFGLPVEGPFDYAVPANLSPGLKAGMRVMVSFGEKKKIGYCVGLSHKTESRYVKDISAVLDKEPLLNAELLKFFKLLASAYFCSWGEMIETALPLSIRKGKRLIPFAGIPRACATREPAEEWREGPEESGGFPGLKSPKSLPIRVRRFLGRRRPAKRGEQKRSHGLCPCGLQSFVKLRKISQI